MTHPDAGGATRARLLAAMAREACRATGRVAHLYSGRGRISRTPLLRRLEGAVHGLQATTLQDGSFIRVDLADYMARPVYYFGDFDPKITWVCRRVLRPGDVAIDCGANIGIVALQMARCVGETGRVHAFEPQPDLAERLVADAATNGYRQLTVHALALSDHDGSDRFRISLDSCGGAAIDDRPAPGYRMIEVEVRRALPVFRELEVPAAAPVRLVKLDLEGHEDVVLPELRPWLAEAAPDVVVYEAGASDAFWSLPRTAALVESGYRIFAIPHCVFRMKLEPLDPGCRIPHGSSDFVAVHAGDHAAGTRRALRTPS